MVEAATIRARIQSREARLRPDQVSRDVHAVFELGYFETSKVDAEELRGRAAAHLSRQRKTHRPRRAVRGNKELKTDDLKEKAALVTHTPQSAVAIAEAVERLRALYRRKGFLPGRDPDGETEPSAKGQITLAFVIEEGEKYAITTISFSGNKQFSAEELRGEIKSK